MRDLLMYGSWHVPCQRPHHFVRLFERQGISTHVLTRRTILQRCPSGFEHQGACSSLRYIRGFPLRSRLTKGLTRRLVARQERRAFRQLADNCPVIIYRVPSVLPKKAKPLVFDSIDDFAWFGPGRNPEIEKLQCRLAKAADIIWATSESLYQRWQAEFPGKVHLIPNGADVEHFAAALSPGREGDSPLSGKQIRVGYFGAISRWFDFQLVTEVAKRLPRVEFILVGPVYSGLEHAWPDNVTVLGARPYAELPRIVREWDCCIIPFLLNELTDATNPVKLFEYLAAGKPVVATSMAEVRRYRSPGVVETAENTEEFVSAIERAVEVSRSEEMVQKRLLVARQNSWEGRFAVACKTLAPFLPEWRLDVEVGA